MTVPNVEVGLLLDGTWVAVTGNTYGVFTRDPISISHGRADWGSKTDPGRATFTLDTRDHDWAPDDIRSAFWGSYRRNIPCRIGVGLGTPYLASGDVDDVYDVAYATDHAAMHITGDIEIQAYFRLRKQLNNVDSGLGLIPSPGRRLVHKNATGAEGFELDIYRTEGEVSAQFTWYDSGGVQHAVLADQSGSFFPYWFQYKPSSVKVTLDVNNGAGGHTVTWYYGTSLSGWTQLGSPIVVAGTTSIKSTTADFRVGGNVSDDPQYVLPFAGEIYQVKLLNAIGGTEVANPNFTAQSVGASSFTDGAGRSWHIASPGRITNMRWRFHGELTSLPVRSDLRGTDIWAPVEATGLLRRLRQGQPVLESPLRRAVTRKGASVVSYWPMEESGNNLLQFGAAIGSQPMVSVNGVYPSTAANHDFTCSAPLPEVGSSVLEARVDGYSGTDWQLKWLMSIPADLTGTDVPILQWATTDMDWQILWQTDGSMKIQASRNGTAVYDSGYIGFTITGQPVRMHVAVQTHGSNVDIDFEAQSLGGVPGGITVSNAVAGRPGQVTLLRFNANGTLGSTAIGHVMVQAAITGATELQDELNAFTGETAGERLLRLGVEEGLAVRVIGDPSDTEAMGPQSQATVVELMEECAATDLGILGEARDSLAVLYRCRSDMVAQNPVPVALDYTAGEVLGVIELDRDDQDFVNDWTVTGSTGATARAVLDDGSPISVSEPPTGAGRYASSETVNGLEYRLVDLANSRLRFTAVDEPRVSNVGVGMHMPAIVADSTLGLAVLGAIEGDLVTVDNVANHTAQVRQILQGTVDTITATQHAIGMLTSPGSPWSSGIVEDSTYVGRYDTAGSELASNASAGATSLSVDTTLGPLWTTTAGDFPFDVIIDGVRVTVSTISGAASPQTFTVSAISRALSAGASVMLADPTYYEM